MLKLFNQSSRGSASPALVAVLGVLAGGLLSRTASAQDAGAIPNCNSIANHVFVVGSSAVEPVLFPPTGVGVAQLLAEDTSPLVIAYQKPGSCVGVHSIIDQTDLSGTAAYWDATTHSKQTCNMAAGDHTIVAATDVFPTSCSMVDAAAVTGASLGDFQPFVQTMAFVVPGISSEQTISAEAAYLTFGLGDTGGTPWDNYTLHYVRNSGSGTETMIGKSIGVPAGSWWGVNTTGGATGVAQTVSSQSATDKVIGIVSTAEAQNPIYHNGGADMHMLAYQAYGQSCAFYPDSTKSALDKAMVRDGHYDIWGPLHLLTKVTAGAPNDATAKKFADVLTGKTLLSVPNTLIDAEISLFEVPLCAMSVMRTEELGPLSSVQPTCDCYFASKTGGAPTSCKTCASNTECTGAGEKCNYGYCQVMP